eukprot:TRINITY_DN18516_c0_g1_i1.p1 TRINITY_DN18516_c0_g1~~TRINITY_DN18516_c0_g1_i1.p1  ORF type:complete len:257 (+),score=53.32 TRINITY_DN18516_c0_g1_i1:64-771(+)
MLSPPPPAPDRLDFRSRGADKVPQHPHRSGSGGFDARGHALPGRIDTAGSPQPSAHSSSDHAAHPQAPPPYWQGDPISQVPLQRVSPSRRWPELAAIAQQQPQPARGGYRSNEGQQWNAREEFQRVIRGESAGRQPQRSQSQQQPSPVPQYEPRYPEEVDDKAERWARRNVFDRLLDPKGFTGTHKHRFDASTGRGRGSRGRDDGPKGRGHEGRGTVHGGSRMNWQGCLRAGSFV